MCGRYSFSTSKEKLREQFGSVETGQNLEINFNVAPTQRGYVITDDSPGTLRQFTWGLVPFWAKDRKIGSRLINARSETIADKPSFRNAVRKRRCWVLADSFYEWKRTDGKKQPFRIFRTNGELLVMAGIWETWKGEEEPLHTYTIITTSPNEEMAPVHDRMPVIFTDLDQQRIWLETPELDEALELLQPAPNGSLEMYAVSTKVNNVRNNGPELHEPLGEQGDLFNQ
jgi:putative SOS response-associated peptidase YedK